MCPKSLTLDMRPSSPVGVWSACLLPLDGPRRPQMAAKASTEPRRWMHSRLAFYVSGCFSITALVPNLYARLMLWLEELVQTEPLAGFLKPNGRRNAENAFMTDLSAAKRYLKETVTSYWHPAGTCAMMPREIGGVVDGLLIVHGTTNLRVVDASVFPLIPRGDQGEIGSSLICRMSE